MEISQKIAAAIAECKLIVEKNTLKIQTILTEQVIDAYAKEHRESAEILFPRRSNLRQRYYQILKMGSEYWMTTNNAQRIKAEKALKAAIELTNFLRYIEHLENQKQSIRYIAIFRNEEGYRYGIFSIKDNYSKAELYIFKTTTSRYYRLQTSNYRKGDLLPAIQNEDGVYFELREVDAVGQKRMYMATKFDRANEVRDILLASYSTISTINEKSLPSAGLMFLCSTKLHEDAISEIINTNSWQASPKILPEIQFDFIRFYLRFKRVAADLGTASAKQLETTREYREFLKTTGRRGIYVGYCFRTWQSNYKTFEQFIIRINSIGEVIIHAVDTTNDQLRFGHITTESSNNFTISFADKAYEYQTFRYSMTLMPDPTTLRFEKSTFLFGVTSGIEKVGVASAGKIAMVKITDDVLDDAQFEKFIKEDVNKVLAPTNFGTARGIQPQIQDLFEKVLSRITQIFEKENEDNQTSEIRAIIKLLEGKKNWLANFFDPDNPYDLTDTMILKRNWKHTSYKGDSNLLKAYEIFLPSDSFHKPYEEIDSLDSTTIEKFKILCYPMLITGKGTVTIIISKKTTVEGASTSVNQNIFTFTCYDKAQYGIQLQGTIKDIEKLDTVEPSEHSFVEGLLNIYFPNKKDLLKSSKAVIFRASEDYSDYSDWIKNSKQKHYSLGRPSELQELETYKPGLVEHLSGQINRLILVQKAKHNDKFAPRFQDNALVYYHAALYSAENLDISDHKEYKLKSYLLHARLHGFPQNEEQIRMFIHETFDSNGKLSTCIDYINAIWTPDKIKLWRDRYYEERSGNQTGRISSSD